MDITKLKGVIPDGIYNQIPGVLSFGIDGPKRLSHLLGECQHETGNWKTFEENLNYSEQGLCKTFPKYFTKQQAKDYARQPQRIANRVYASRGGNGNEASGMGWLYRGRGCLQTTFHDNYKALGDYLHVDILSNPDLVATDCALSSAAFFFMKNHLWTICDQGITDDVCKIICRRVNGPGMLGLVERNAYTKEFYSILTT